MEETEGKGKADNGKGEFNSGKGGYQGERYGYNNFNKFCKYKGE